MHDVLVTKAMPFQFIDGNKLKTYKMGLTNHTWPISHHITPLVINGFTGGHTHTDARTKTISRNQACAAFGPAQMVLKSGLST